MTAPFSKLLVSFFLLSTALSSASEHSKATVDERINAFMQPLTDWVFKFVFISIDIPLKGGSSIAFPLILVWLVGAALLFTFFFRFINIRALPLAIKTVKGKYSKDDDPGEITHFQALSAALSATVGLGNIAGVAIAISLGGPGAVFWMILAGFLGMTSKFCECTLGVKYRQIIDGKVYGGPMYYLQEGFKERDMRILGKALAILFAIMCVGAAFGGGNMFQANQSGQQLLGVIESKEHLHAQKELDQAQAQLKSLEKIKLKIKSVKEHAESLNQIDHETRPFYWRNQQTQDSLLQVQEQLQLEEQGLSEHSQYIQEAKQLVAQKEALVLSTQGFFSKHRWVFGLIIATLVGFVIIGGISSIAKVTAMLVPFMTVIYLLACLTVLGAHFSEVPAAFKSILVEAFKPTAIAGGAIGAFIQGIRRAAFSNEAGFGSAPIAHAAVKTRFPASEGLVALLEPFMDTVVVCTMTGLSIIVTASAHNYSAGNGGIQLTSAAFESVVPFFKYILLVCVLLFAFSTMISWSYYGQQAWSYLFGKHKYLELLYKLLFCGFIVIGSSLSLGSVLDFSDGMLFAMSFFNLIGVYVLFPVVKRELIKFKKHTELFD